jgi:hypothetical protein
MKIKCTSKRQFKKILKQMIPYVLLDPVKCEIYASDYYKCGIKIYKKMEITYINKVWMHDNRHQIYIGMKGMWKLPKNTINAL